MGAIDLHEVPRSVRLLRWALPVQRVNIRSYAPDTPKGALMQTMFACLEVMRVFHRAQST